MSAEYSGTGVMRLRCEKELKGAEGRNHLAINVRMPMALSDLPKVLRQITKCVCGADLMVCADEDKRVGQ